MAQTGCSELMANRSISLCRTYSQLNRENFHNSKVLAQKIVEQNLTPG
jgi:hypothetical protein